jgi:hypothetical protein
VHVPKAAAVRLQTGCVAGCGAGLIRDVDVFDVDMDGQQTWAPVLVSWRLPQLAVQQTTATTASSTQRTAGTLWLDLRQHACEGNRRQTVEVGRIRRVEKKYLRTEHKERINRSEMTCTQHKNAACLEITANILDCVVDATKRMKYGRKREYAMRHDLTWISRAANVSDGWWPGRRNEQQASCHTGFGPKAA